MTTPRDVFRQAVAESAEAAKQALPQSASRIDSAVALVLSGDVELHPDGTATVGSRTDPLKKYSAVNGVCSCMDFQHAPEQWCSHRIARGLFLRAERAVKALLPAAPVPEPSDAPDATTSLLEAKNVVSPSTLPEAAASATVRLTIAGHSDVLFTVRDMDEGRLLARLETLLSKFPVAPAQPVARSPQGETGEGWCKVHRVQMKFNVAKPGKGKDWWSHKVGEGFCKGK
jgi:hypothetical protein